MGWTTSRNGDKVLVRITEFPEDTQPPAGGRGRAQLRRGRRQRGRDKRHHGRVRLAVRISRGGGGRSRRHQRGYQQDEIARRRDFRDITTFTIDPADAKDFDDALSMRKLENGHWEVGVHIADVTHYVRPGTELEREGKHRATSVYLVDRVIPMLPERLCNGLCSLRPQRGQADLLGRV